MTRAEYRADLALAFTPDQKLGRQHQAGFGGVENTVVKFVSCLGSLKQSKTLAQLSPSSLLSRLHEHRKAGCRIRQHRQILADECSLKCLMPRCFDAPWEGSWVAKTPFPGVCNMTRSSFCMLCCLKGAAGLRFGAAMNAHDFPCTSAFSPCFHGILREAEHGCQHREESLIHFWIVMLAWSPWSHAGRVPEDPLCWGSCTAALRDKSR